MTLIYISTDLGFQSSGGLVASKEYEFLQEFGKEIGEDVISFEFKDIHPLALGMLDNPFLIDYLMMGRLLKTDLSRILLVQLYGGSYGQTVHYLKSKGIKTSYSCMMHNRQISIDEHEKINGPNTYPFAHVKVDRLWKMYVVDAIQNADIVITPGQAPKTSLLNEGANNVQIIPHGTNIPHESNIKPFPKEFRVGYLGAYGPDKGIKYLIKAWGDLNYQDGLLIFAGSQSQNMQLFIEHFTQYGRFHLMGFIEDVADFYNNISVYIQPSASEGFGIETLEALSFGRPVICSNGAGSADCITDGIDGFVVPTMNSQAIAEKIRYFKDSPNEIIRMGKNAREKSYQFSWENVKQKYINLWRSLLSNEPIIAKPTIDKPIIVDEHILKY